MRRICAPALAGVPLAVFCVLLLSLSAACGRQATSSSPAAPSLSTPGLGNLCAPTQSAPAGPLSDPNGPYFHRVAVGHTTDGVRITNIVHVLEHASVPDGVRLATGEVLVYYVDGADNSLGVASLTGAAAQPLGAITLNGIARPNGIVDPDAQMVGGRVRLFYLGGFGSPTPANPRAMCVAESSDGRNFTVIGSALTFSGELWTDPSVVPLASGGWLMAVSAGNNTVMARSNDGLTFVAGERLTYGGVPELAALADGRVRLYVCAQGIQSYVSGDRGSTWNHEGTVLNPGGLTCDPSLVAGTDRFVFKTGY
jgi:hypothetical protein